MTMDGPDATREQPLPYGAFVSYIGRELGIELPGSSRDLLIGLDLELDSVTMIELVVAIEDLGAELPADIFLTAKTLGEVYDRYLTAVGARAGGPEAGPQRDA
jgi:acyl carrier protein